MKYPPRVQKMIVEWLIGPRAAQDEDEGIILPAESREKKFSASAEGIPANTEKAMASAEPGDSGDAFGDSEIKSLAKPKFDRAEFNRARNRPDGAGAAWSAEEDERLKQEFQEGMTMAEMARRHSRTRGGIKARLKKHGLIEM